MRKRIFSLNHIYIAISLLLLVNVFAEVTSRLSIFDPIQRAINNFSILDIYFQIQDMEEEKIESPFITIVDISKLYDRGRIAETIYDINACKPAVTGFDVIFEGIRCDSIGSQFVEEAVHEASNPIAAFRLKAKDDTGNFTNATHSFFLPTEHMEEGYINLQSVASGGVIREMGTWNILNGDTVHSLSCLMARKYIEDITGIKSVDKWPKRCIINYTPTKFPVVPYDSVLHQESLIKDRIVLLGTTKEEEDMHYSPLGSIPGCFIHAYAIQTLIEHHHIYEVDLWLNILITFLVLVFTSMVQSEISYRARHSKSITIRFLFQTDLVKNIMNFLWMAVLVGFNYVVVFKHCNRYFNPTIMLVCIALLVEVSQFCEFAGKMWKRCKLKKTIDELMAKFKKK